MDFHRGLFWRGGAGLAMIIDGPRRQGLTNRIRGSICPLTSLDRRPTAPFEAAALEASRFCFVRDPALKAKTVEDRALLELIEPVAESLGLDIVRVRLMGGTLRRRLQIMAERPTDHDIAVEECARLSRAVSEVLDAADPISGEYLLEVSSPGVDRPLTRQSDFDLFEGFEARLETDRMIEGRKRFKGTIAGTEGENIAIDLDGEEDTALIPFDWLVDAKLVLTDELMKAGAEKRAARNDNNEPDTED
jgi:ribosome maturation factor RimP